MQTGQANNYLRLTGLTVVAFVAILSGCGQSPSRLEVLAESRVAPAPTLPDVPLEFRQYETTDALFSAIAAAAPGFGGMYWSGPTIVSVYAQSDDQKERVLRVLSVFLEHLRVVRGAERIDVQFETGRFDYRDLMVAREVAQEAFSVAGVYSVDTDEKLNAVTVGAAPEAVERARSWLAERGLVEPLAQVFPRAAPKTYMTLSDDLHPYMGGTEIEFLTAAGTIGGCTLGLPVEKSVWWGWEDGILTNSHCSMTLGGVSSNAYFQSDYGTAGDKIATENEDPAWVNGKRFSDALYALRPSLGSPSARDFTIAMPNSGPCGTTPCSTTVANSTTFFTVTGILDPAHALVGTDFDKVGQASGWTRGDIIHSCYDQAHNLSGTYIARCTYQILAAALPGDSGSPVFHDGAPGPEVNFSGLLWGGEPDRNKDGIYEYDNFFMSSAINIGNELSGPIRVCANTSSCSL